MWKSSPWISEKKKWRKVLEASCLVVKFAPFHHEMKLRRRQATNTPVITAGRRLVSCKFL